jgi:endonuclease YncB( thermonuclease family)
MAERWRERRGGLVALTTAVVVVVSLAACDERDQRATNDRAQTASTRAVQAEEPSSASTRATTTSSAGITVTRVIDGDTLVVDDGRHVRLAQVDAAETYECFGSEATAALRGLADGAVVTLRRPPAGPATDRYGRTLADVLVAGESVNEALVRDGAAEWYEQFADEDADLAARLAAAETDAMAAHRGLWSACGDVARPATAAPPPPSTVTTLPSGDCAPAYPDDCLPSGPDLDCPDIGHPVRVDHTYGDPLRLDADDDGVGCES